MSGLYLVGSGGFFKDRGWLPSSLEMLVQCFWDMSLETSPGVTVLDRQVWGDREPRGFQGPAPSLSFTLWGQAQDRPYVLTDAGSF